MPTGKHVEDGCNVEIMAHGQKYYDKEIRPRCLRNVGVALPLTAAVANDRAVVAHTLELEQNSLKELRFRMIDIGPFLDLQLEWGHIVEAKQEGGAP